MEHGKDMNNPPGKYQRSNVWYNDTSRHRKSRPQKRKRKKDRGNNAKKILDRPIYAMPWDSIPPMVEYE